MEFRDPENKLLYQEISHMRESLDQIRDTLKGFNDKFVTKSELKAWRESVKNQIEALSNENALPKKILYSGIGIVLITVLVAILGLVVLKVSY